MAESRVRLGEYVQFVAAHSHALESTASYFLQSVPTFPQRGLLL
jgi:hypothetical protein